MFHLNRLKNPKPLIPISMAFMVSALVWLRYLHLTVNPTPRWADGACGILFGISIGLGLVYIVVVAVKRSRTAAASH